MVTVMVEERSSPEQNRYRSYVLRLWRDETSGSPWRASIAFVDPPMDRLYFAEIADLVKFIREETQQ